MYQINLQTFYFVKDYNRSEQSLIDKRINLILIFYQVLTTVGTWNSNYQNNGYMHRKQLETWII